MWTVNNARELYGIDNWGNGFFAANEKGNVVIQPTRNTTQQVDIVELIDEIENAQDLEFPVVLRFPQILEGRIDEIAGAFSNAIKELNYTATYRPVFPMKVNQRKEVFEYILKYGAKHNLGVEVGTKGELLAALALGAPKDSLIVCNGYKDEDYLKLALSVHSVYNIILVVDLYEEIYDILKYADEMGVVPRIGMRLKLFSRGSGHWVESGGDASKFGLSTSEALEIMKILKERNISKSLQLMHFHIGSQITDIRMVKSAMNEIARIYAQIRKTANVLYLNVGGGLSVDYNGSQTSMASSANYTLQEYANDVVYAIQKVCDEENVPCPTIISESGRAITAYHSMIIYKMIGKKDVKDNWFKEPLADDPIQIKDFYEDLQQVNADNYQEKYHSALQYRDELYDAFVVGNIGLEERAKGELLFRMLCRKALTFANAVGDDSEEVHEMKKTLSQKYIANFSLFQSFPDMWALDQIFPTVPLHRWNEEPTEYGTIVDITCDSDGEVKHYAGDSDGREFLALHSYKDGEDYYVGTFLLGAYQDTLGDFHNLLGSAHEVHVMVDQNDWWVCQKVEGDTCRKLLDFFNYETKDYTWDVMDRCVENNQCVNKKEHERIEAQLNKTLKGYTYFIEKVNKPTNGNGNGAVIPPTP